MFAFVAALAAETAEAAAAAADDDAEVAELDALVAAAVAVAVAALTVAVKAVVSRADCRIMPSSRWISFKRESVALMVVRALLSSWSISLPGCCVNGWLEECCVKLNDLL